MQHARALLRIHIRRYIPWSCPLGYALVSVQVFTSSSDIPVSEFISLVCTRDCRLATQLSECKYNALLAAQRDCNDNVHAVRPRVFNASHYPQVGNSTARMERNGFEFQIYLSSKMIYMSINQTVSMTPQRFPPVCCIHIHYFGDEQLIDAISSDNSGSRWKIR